MEDGQIIECDMVGPIEVRFLNRLCQVDAIVLLGDSEPLLGAIPMEDMDVMVHPKRQVLDAHPDHTEGLWMMKRMRYSRCLPISAGSGFAEISSGPGT